MSWYKANIDAALFKESTQGGMGVDFRDSNGLVLAALSEVVNDVHDGGDNRSFDIHKRYETCS